MHNKELYKARAVLLDSIRREEQATGTALPLAHWHLARICAQLKGEQPNALTHAQRELALLKSADPAVPPALLEEVEATAKELKPEE